MQTGAARAPPSTHVRPHRRDPETGNNSFPFISHNGYLKLFTQSSPTLVRPHPPPEPALLALCCSGCLALPCLHLSLCKCAEEGGGWLGWPPAGVPGAASVGWCKQLPSAAQPSAMVAAQQE